MKDEELLSIRERLDRSSPVPVYYQLSQKLASLILSGKLKSGERLPGDLYLARLFGVNYRTLQKAIHLLQKDGLLEKTRYLGTVVRNNNSISPSIGFFYLREATNMLIRAEYLQKVLSSHFFDLKIHCYDTPEYFEKISLWEEVRRKQLKAAVIVPVQTENCLRDLLELEENHFPYVRFGRSFFQGKLKAPLVRGDDVKRTKEALDYLWNLGHRRIGLISSFRGNESEQVYLNFYQDKPDFLPRWLMSLEFTGTEEQWQHYPSQQVARGYWEHNPDVTALLVENSFAALDFLKEAMRMRKEVPRDFSLLSLTDWVGLDRSVVRITAMHLSDKEMGEAAARVVLDLLQGGNQQETVFIPYRLIERGSVGRPSVFRGVLGQRR